MEDQTSISEAETPPLPQSPNWRWWMTWGCIGVMFLLMLWLRTTDYTGVEVIKQGDESMYRMLPTAMLPFALPIVVGLLLAFALVTLPAKLPRLLAVIPFLAALTILVALPTVMTARLVVSPTGFEHTAGFWWAPATKVVRFADLESITFRPRERGERKPPFTLVCRERDGGEIEIPKSTLLEAGLRHIFGQALHAGVAIEGWAIED